MWEVVGAGLVVALVLAAAGGRGMMAGLWGGGVPAIDARTLAQRLEDKATAPVLLDVREPYEFAAGHIEGAFLIPLGVLKARANEVPKDRPVVVVCHSGSRSAYATAFLRDLGHTNVENLTGGMISWSRLIRARGRAES